MANFVVLILLLFGIATVVSQCEEQNTLSSISSESMINPPASGILISTSQKNFVEHLINDIVETDEKLTEIRALPESSVTEKERKTRAKSALLRQRRDLWKEITTPVDFDGFSGVIDSIDTSTSLVGDNMGLTFLSVDVLLFGSGITLELAQFLDDKNEILRKREYHGDWEIFNLMGKRVQWFDLNEGDAIMISGSFLRYSENRKWVHCCVSSTSWPSFFVTADEIRILEKRADEGN